MNTIPDIEPPDAPPAEFWTHQWRASHVVDGSRLSLFMCWSCLVRADRPEADQPCDHAADVRRDA